MWRAEGRRRFPVNGLVYYAPLWHPQLNVSPFKAWDLVTPGTHSCTVAGATWGSTGRTFAGSDNDLITVPDAAIIQNIFATGGTLSMWVNPSSSIASGLTLISKVGWNVYWNVIVAGRTAPTFFYDFDANDGYFTFATGLLVDTFSHICITMANTTAGTVPIFYVNGGLIGTTVTQASTGTVVTDAGSNILLGNRAALDKDFLGIIGELSLYNQVLTAGEIAQSYRGTKFRY